MTSLARSVLLLGTIDPDRISEKSTQLFLSWRREVDVPGEMHVVGPPAMHVVNTTPLAVDVSTPPAVSDPSTRRLLVTAKATFDLDLDGTPHLDSQDPEPIVAKETEDPRFPGFILPPDPAIQVFDHFQVMLIHTLELDEPATSTEVTLNVGQQVRRLRVVGDRWLVDGVATDPQPFTSMPLSWDRAHGGMPVFEVAPAARLPMPHPTNPLGRGHFPEEVAQTVAQMLGYADEGYPRAHDPAPPLANLLPSDAQGGVDLEPICWAPMPGAVSLRCDLPRDHDSVPPHIAQPPIDDYSRWSHRDLVMTPAAAPGTVLHLSTLHRRQASWLRLPSAVPVVEVSLGDRVRNLRMVPQAVVWLVDVRRCTVTYRLAARFDDDAAEHRALRLHAEGFEP